MKLSYECSDLIAELESDIQEFGNIDMYAFFKKINDLLFLTNYDFISKEMPLQIEEFDENTIVKIMKAEEILNILKEQNSIL